MNRPPLAVADMVQQYGAAFLARYGATLSSEQHRTLRAIALCRTPPLGATKRRVTNVATKRSAIILVAIGTAPSATAPPKRLGSPPGSVWCLL